MIDKRFDNARYAVLAEKSSEGGIGTYSERSLHKILKFYLEPDEGYHEIKVKGYVADIKRENEIIEIQTRSMSRLIPKLERFLPDHKVTVVYPLEHSKYIRWIDRDTGEISERRKSPKIATVFDSIYELYNIRRFIGNENLAIKLVFLNVEEFRYRNAKAFGKTRDKVRVERIPLSLERVIDIRGRGDYRIFIPDGLPDIFTAADFNRAVSKRFKYGYSCISILRAVGLADDGEKKGRITKYRLIPSNPSSEDGNDDA